MTKEQKIIQISKEYRKYRESCGVVNPVELDEIEDAHYDGYVNGQKGTIDKACEWLKENKNHPLIGCEDPCLSGYLTDEFIEQFKKAMKE